MRRHTQKVKQYIYAGEGIASLRKGNSDNVCAPRWPQSWAHVLAHALIACITCERAALPGRGRFTRATQVAGLQLPLSAFETASTSSMEKTFTYREATWLEVTCSACGFKPQWEVKRLIWKNRNAYPVCIWDSSALTYTPCKFNTLSACLLCHCSGCYFSHFLR